MLGEGEPFNVIGVLIREKTHTHRGESQVKTDTERESRVMTAAELGVMGLWAKEQQGLLATPSWEKGAEQILSQDLQNIPANIWILDF